MLLLSNGVTTSKIWTFSPGLYSSSSSELISFTDTKKLSPTGTIDWGYHVAPILHVQKGKEISEMVIDLGLFPEGPVHYKTWLNKLKTRKLLHLIMDADWYLFNSSMIPNYQLNNDPAYDHDQNVDLPYFFWDKLINDFFKYEGESKDNKWLPKGLAINETAMVFYNNEIAPILKMNSHKELVQDYKNLVGNVFNFETVFRDDKWNYDMTPEFQEKYQFIISKYKESYFTNLNKWDSMASTLENNLLK